MPASARSIHPPAPRVARAPLTRLLLPQGVPWGLGRVGSLARDVLRHAPPHGHRARAAAEPCPVMPGARRCQCLALAASAAGSWAWPHRRGSGHSPQPMVPRTPWTPRLAEQGGRAGHADQGMDRQTGGGALGPGPPQTSPHPVLLEQRSICRGQRTKPTAKASQRWTKGPSGRRPRRAWQSHQAQAARGGHWVGSTGWSGDPTRH